ncbi:putative two-component system response regulator [Thermosipho japonicus]|uniref:Putative two-component system response regulator n=1 Tax=Thermosipho japonicus TaxID=90323 RepID=A0A841GEA8_9BACT|nr:HD domain-containing phosphohydrolase [Thermosipho japonicus]MBB6061956.1 putative two-component system response regulator [Thermosipho japonicus]
MIRILVVEDEREIRKMLEMFLKHKGFDVITVENGKRAVEIMEKEKDSINVVITDILMPEMDGITAVKEIRKSHFLGPIIMLTAYSDKEMLDKAAEIGVDDFISKPVNFELLTSRINMLMSKYDFYTTKNIIAKKVKEEACISKEIIKQLHDKNEQLVMEMIKILNVVSEYRDDETHEHTLRVGWVSSKIAEEIGLEKAKVADIYFGAQLHDIGKIGIPDRILLKPGKLDEEEYEIMKGHTIIGYNILRESSTSLLKTAAVIAKYHHERWNGKGYPEGLKGEEIPIEARIVAIADSLDAIVSKRPYKRARPLTEAFEEMKELSGILYDPKLVNALFKVKDNICKFYQSKMQELKHVY